MIARAIRLIRQALPGGKDFIPLYSRFAVAYNRGAHLNF